ncbi:MAG: hypothetical protein ACYC5K_10000, partial [Saccharofermentanales bacterium]
PVSDEILASNITEKARILSGWWNTGNSGIELHQGEAIPGYVFIDMNQRNGSIRGTVTLRDAKKAGLTCRGRIIVINHADELAGYHIVLDAENQEIALYTRVAQLRKFSAAPFQVRLNTGYQLEVILEDEKISVIVDGVCVISARDELPMQPGHYTGCCGLYSDGGCTEFNNVFWANQQ